MKDHFPRLILEDQIFHCIIEGFSSMGQAGLPISFHLKKLGFRFRYGHLL
jgi:hypothetical protein